MLWNSVFCGLWLRWLPLPFHVITITAKTLIVQFVMTC